MIAKRAALASLLAAGIALTSLQYVQAQANPPASPYNTVKTKLAKGQQVVGGTVSIPDPGVYCAVANGGFD
ncbi:MAG: hypothetical protein AB7P22_07730, partial [Vicinamibacterales bacterium]